MINQWRFREPNLNSIPVSIFSVEEIIDTIVALANTNGGTLSGFKPTSPHDITALAKQCTPPIDIEMGENADHIFGYVPRSRQIHATPDGRVLVRSKHENVQLDGNQIRQLSQMRNIGDYENEVVPGTNLNDFDSETIQHFANLQKHQDFAIDTISTLTKMGAINEQHQPTVAGILLFRPLPQQWLPQSSITIKQLVGKISTSHKAKVIQQIEIQGNLPTLLHQFYEWVEGSSNTINKVIDLPSIYPASVILETITNAVIHREYRLRDCIETRIFDDGIQIISPGNLPGFVTQQNMTRYRFYRNPNIAHVMLCWEYHKNINRKHDQIGGEVAIDKHISMQFTSSNHQTIVSLIQNDSSYIKTTETTISISINWRQERAIRYIQECGSLTYHEFHALCPNIERQTLFSDLVDLVDKNLLVKAGNSKNVFFYLQHQ